MHYHSHVCVWYMHSTWQHMQYFKYHFFSCLHLHVQCIDVPTCTHTLIHVHAHTHTPPPTHSHTHTPPPTHAHPHTLTATMPAVNSSRETVSSLSSELMKLRTLATRCTVRVRPLDFHLLSQSSQLQTTWMSTETKVGGSRSHDNHMIVMLFRC